MTATVELFDDHWLVNTLLDDGYVAQLRAQLRQSPAGAQALGDWLAQRFDAQAFARRSEAQLEERFIGPLLETLGWATVPQEQFVVQGKTAKPDWCLLTHPGDTEQLIATADHRMVTAICEAKAWDKSLDTGKADRASNPHHQLQDYLSTLRIRFGFLTNGRIWRVYDTEKITARKTFVQFDLEAICGLADAAQRQEALALFAFFFGRDTYVGATHQDAVSPIEAAIAQSADFTLAVEENLKAVIYGYDGEDSMFEIMGRAIYRANANASMQAVYENSVVLLFRLLFVVYFEDKNRDLLARHPFYNRFSLTRIYQSLPADGDGAGRLFDGIFALKRLFALLDEGAEDIDVPLFNGGLFDPARAPLLQKPKLLDNAALRQILEKLLYRTSRGRTLFETRRDFKNMSVTHLGRIYEGLLEFRFEQAAETAFYLEYESAATRGKTVEAYFDAYDMALLRKERGFRAVREVAVRSGDVYLKSASNSRKVSASYYTPAALSRPLVERAIAQALGQAHDQGRSFTDIRVLDNACGSGHFLVEALGALTDEALARLESDESLRLLVAAERAKIVEQLRFLNLDYEPEEAQILKRALLKRCIFGVDLNPFAVELARLSLWMDTFVFGTPLSFIEHHIQHGNALMGASVEEFRRYQATVARQDDLFVDNLGARFDSLRAVMQELDAMRDTTAREVEESKRLWARRIVPRLRLLSRALSFVCTRRALLAEGNREACQALDKTPNLLAHLFDEQIADNPALQQVEEYARRFRFFHYEVAFPEAFSGARWGFDLIVGNPPWDKVKLFDTDFFPQYHSNYRSLKNSEKAAVQRRLLESPQIRQAYDEAKRSTETANEYYKDKAVFPLNKGAGDANLFRLFVERNLELLAPGGSLNYVLPSALMFEEGSTLLRQHLFSRCQVPFFYSFENRNGLFPDVDSRYKFALLQVVNAPPGADTPPTDTAFYVLDAADLQRPEVRVPYPLALLKALSPEHWALMELRDRKDLPILQKCYSVYSALSPDWLDFRRELHMTDDKDLFIETPAPGLLPLYEGKMIWQYSHLFEKPQYWLSKAAFDRRMHSKELHRMAQDLGVPRAEAAKHEADVRYDREFIRLGFREVARDTDERTLIFSLLPKGIGLGHKVTYNVPKRYVRDANGTATTLAVSPLRTLFALAWFNSVAVDWLARFMIQISVSQTYLFRLPIPQPGDEEIRAHPDYALLARNALRLSLAARWDDFAELAPLFALTPADVPATAKARDQLRAENDRIVARLYGITDAELAHILRSFPVMADKRPEYLALLQ